MPRAVVNIIAEGGGVVIRGSIVRDANQVPAIEIPLAAGKTGQLTTRTDNETGTLTMDSGHGITTGAIIDLYWSTGSRRQITVGTVSSNSVPIGADNSGVGDNLPTNLTSIVACVRTVIGPITLDGDNCSLIVAALEVAPNSTGKGNIQCEDADDDLIADVPLVAGEPQILAQSGSDLTNPMTGDVIDQIHASNGGTVAATLKLIPAVDITN